MPQLPQAFNARSNPGTTCHLTGEEPTFRKGKWLAQVTQGSVTTRQPAGMAGKECQCGTDLTGRQRRQRESPVT